jgi:hypothetical protein
MQSIVSLCVDAKLANDLKRPLETTLHALPTSIGEDILSSVSTLILHRNVLFQFALAAGASAASLGCSSDDGAPAVPPSETSATTSVQGSSGDGIDLLCRPGEMRCEGESAVAVCEPTGTAWGLEPCKANQMCCDGTDLCPTPRCFGPCESEDLLPSSAGCSFIANRQLHLVEGVFEYHGLLDERHEPDAIVVANPNTEMIATIQVFRVPEGKSKEEEYGEPHTLAPGEYDVYEIDTAFVAGTSTMFRSGGMFRIESDAPVVAYHHAPYRAFLGNDSSMLLPESALGNVYVVASYAPHSATPLGIGRPSYFEIIAVENQTTVSWMAQFAATGGNGLPVKEVLEGEWSQEIKMNRFDTLRVAASRNYNQDNHNLQDVSGTVVVADKPIWVVGASRCSRVPVREEPVAGYCDPLQELLLPLEYWGSSYVVAHPPLRTSERHYWRVYGAEAGVTIDADRDIPGLPYTFESRGDFVEIVVPYETSFMLTGSGAFMPVGYLQSRHQNGEPTEEMAAYGNPAMYQLVPTGQFLNRYVFATGVSWDDHFVQITRQVGSAEVRLNGDVVEAFDEQIGDYEVATVPIEEGTHIIDSIDDFGIVQFGWAWGEHEACEAPVSPNNQCHSSYAYPGGMKSLQIYVP